MKNVVMIFVILDMYCLVGLTYKFYNKLYNLKSKCIVKYEYTDIYGKKGYSKHCFEQNNIFICRDTKHAKKVLKIEKKEMCKNETK
jgi:hypothetical protein